MNDLSCNILTQINGGLRNLLDQTFSLWEAGQN